MTEPVSAVDVIGTQSAQRLNHVSWMHCIEYYVYSSIESSNLVAYYTLRSLLIVTVERLRPSTELLARRGLRDVLEYLRGGLVWALGVVSRPLRVGVEATAELGRLRVLARRVVVAEVRVLEIGRVVGFLDKKL
jgi:hypothetical protein